MDHLAPGNDVKSYWTMWDIPARTTALPKNVKGVGKVGTGFKAQSATSRRIRRGPARRPTCSRSTRSPRRCRSLPSRRAGRDVLLAAMKDKVLASASLNVVYARDSASAPLSVRRATPNGRPKRPRRRRAGRADPVARAEEKAARVAAS